MAFHWITMPTCKFVSSLVVAGSLGVHEGGAASPWLHGLRGAGSRRSPLPVLREDCSSSLVLFNIYHSLVMQSSVWVELGKLGRMSAGIDGHKHELLKKGFSYRDSASTP